MNHDDIPVSDTAPAANPAVNRFADRAAAVVLGSDTRNMLLVGLVAWLGTLAAVWTTFRVLGFEGYLVDPTSSFNLALGFAGGAAGLLLYGSGRTFFRADQAWPTLCGLALYALPATLAVALPWALVGPGRVDLEATTLTALETTPVVLALFALLTTPAVRHSVAGLATTAAARIRAHGAA